MSHRKKKENLDTADKCIWIGPPTPLCKVRKEQVTSTSCGVPGIGSTTSPGL